MMQFKGFKPEAMKKIQGSLGFQGYPEEFEDYLDQNPDKKSMMDDFNKKATEMANGGLTRKFSNGGDTHDPWGSLKNSSGEMLTGDQLMERNYARNKGGDIIEEGESGKTVTVANPNLPDYVRKDAEGNTLGITDMVAQKAYLPALPTGTEVQAGLNDPRDNQFIDADTGVGQVGESIMDRRAVQATAGQADLTKAVHTTKESANEAMGAYLKGAVDIESRRSIAPRGTVSDTVDAQEGKSTVGDLEAAQGEAVKLNNPMQREIKKGELISGSADAVKAAKFTEQIQAAEATPSKQATVKGQLAGMMEEFEGGSTPAWAAGAMRTATEQMLARGMGASSMAGQAIIQAAMESALPIAQMDASTVSKFEQQNLSNKQQRAMSMAEQRAKFMGQEFDQAFQSRVANASKIGEIANMNFTAEQQIALENSRTANTMELHNVGNRQALVIAEASAIANMDLSNLGNRQQAQVQNAKMFLDMDMSNLSNKQQANMFKSQQRFNSIFTDTAQTNAHRQFNATSKNQTDQFFSGMDQQHKQYNASVSNANEQFNAGQDTAVAQFNADIRNQRDTFNANNGLVIDQGNAQWRRQVATANTATVNRTNELNASSLLGISSTNMNNLWQHYSDNMEYAWKSTDNERERLTELAKTQMQVDGSADAADAYSTAATASAFGKTMMNLFLTGFSST